MIDVRFQTSFRMPQSNYRSLGDVCVGLSERLRSMDVSDVEVRPDNERVQAAFTVRAESFNQANVESGKKLLRAMDLVGVGVGDPDDIERIGTLSELTHANSMVMADQYRRLSFA